MAANVGLPTRKVFASTSGMPTRARPFCRMHSQVTFAFEKPLR